MSYGDGKIKSAFREVFKNPPSTLKKGQSPAKKKKQMIAIALSKARQSGAKVPKK